MVSKNGKKIGKVKNFYFDSQQLIVRYIIVDTGNWLMNRKVLISPESFEELNWQEEVLLTNLSKEEIENSPPIDAEKPVSRQMEEKLTKYHQWTNYWSVNNDNVQHIANTGYAVRPSPLSLKPDSPKAVMEEEEKFDENLGDEIQRIEDNKADKNVFLRSFKEVKGYDIKAIDGVAGHLESLLVDENNWIVKYLILDTKKLFAGKKLLIAAEWLESVSYKKKTFYIKLEKDKIKDAPEYSPETEVTHDYQKELYEHFDRDYPW